jgi:hypothetical protein
MGRLLLPGDPGWDHARQAWDLAADQPLLALAVVSSVPDTSRIILSRANQHPAGIRH